MILFLKPYFEVKPWAGDKLNKLYDCPDGTGEAWIISGYNNKSSIITNGKYKGETLRHVWMKHPELFKGINEKEFPLLIKIIDAKEDLSVQVHPSDSYALEHHNSLGKFECWYFLNQNEAKTCIAGIEASKQLDVKEYLEDNVLTNKLIHREVSNGDLVVIEPGTVHALQAGSLVLEVQESSDITYRLFDYNRGRPLHIKDSLNVIKYNDKKNPIYPFQKSDEFDSKYFKISKVFTEDYFKCENDRFIMSYCIDGEILINGHKVKKGDSFIICSDEKHITIEGKGRGLLIEPKPKEEGRVKVRKIALITGIVTQDGSYLTDFLLKKNYEVHGLITSKSQLRSSKIKHLVDNDEIYNKRLFFHLGDLTDTSSLNRLIENVRPDEIYNLASQSHVDVSFELPEYTAQVNSLDLKTKLFNESTSQLYGGNVDNCFQNEETPFNPQNPYATSKLYSHFIVRNYRDNYGLYAVNGIMFNHTSTRDDEDFIMRKVTNAVAKMALGSDEKLIVGNVDAARDWGFSDDFVEGMWLSLQQEKPNDYVFATGEAHTVKELIECAFKVIGIKITWVGEGVDLKGINEVTGNVLVEVSPDLFRINDNKYLQGDSTKAKKVLGWNPKHKFEDIVKLMVRSEINNKRRS